MHRHVREASELEETSLADKRAAGARSGADLSEQGFNVSANYPYYRVHDGVEKECSVDVRGVIGYEPPGRLGGDVYSTFWLSVSTATEE
jgi:hypothetical protein